jgi:hypothetical protein
MTFQVPIIITAFNGEPNLALKRHMTKTMVKHLKERDMFVCLASHSTHDEETLSYCDVFIYDKDNSFPRHYSGGHGIAELRSIYNAIAILKQKGFTSFIKATFDLDPSMDFKFIAEKSIETGKEAVTTFWGHSTNTLSTMLFYSKIDFFERTLSMDEANSHHSLLETVWFKSLMNKGCMSQILVTNPYEPGLFGLNTGYINHSAAGGTILENNYSW